MKSARPHLGLSLVSVPHRGGIFQYNLSAAKAVEPLVDEGWRLTAFVVDPGWRDLLRPEVALVRLRGRTVYRITAQLCRMAGPGVLRDFAALGLHGTARVIGGVGCDLVLYPSEDEEAYLAPGRALVAIHDIMHRYEREFSEYRGILLHYRERHFRALCEAAAGLLVDSELGRQQVMESYGAARGRTHVLPYVVPPALASAPPVDVRARHGLPERFLFYPAQFWEHKNHVRLLEALALLRQRGVVAPVVFCGAPKNGYRGVLRAIERLGLAAQVRILGYVPDQELASLYRQAVATVFVSLIGPTNIPPLEAMALGSPLVVSRAYAMPEQVGDAALLVDARDVRDIASQVERIWGDAALRTELARRGMERSTRWTQDYFGERLRAIIRGLVQVPARRDGDA